jgi:hypothetical protein
MHQEKDECPSRGFKISVKTEKYCAGFEVNVLVKVPYSKHKIYYILPNV